jgi:hypothetical protein
MTDVTVGRVGRSFWAIGVVAVIWNVLGTINFFRQMNAGAVAAMPEAQRAIIEGRPVWATAAFAIVNVTGALGGILLLRRKAAANYFFIASLVSVVVQMFPYLGMPASTFDAAVVLYVLMPLVMAAWLVWYSSQARNRGWLA